MFEHLRQRRLLTIPLSGGVATVTGTANNDVLEIVVISGVLQVRDGGGIVINSVSATGVTGISVNGSGGADFIRMGRGDGTFMPGVPCTLRGGAGNDTIIGGMKDDQLFGESENDRLNRRAGRDVLDGGLGFDTADYAARTVQVKVTLANSTTANDGSNSGDNTAAAKYNDLGGDNCKDVEGVLGGTAGDILAGSTAANWFDGGGGNDSIYGDSRGSTPSTAAPPPTSLMARATTTPSTCRKAPLICSTAAPARPRRSMTPALTSPPPTSTTSPSTAASPRRRRPPLPRPQSRRVRRRRPVARRRASIPAGRHRPHPPAGAGPKLHLHREEEQSPAAAPQLPHQPPQGESSPMAPFSSRAPSSATSSR